MTDLLKNTSLSGSRIILIAWLLLALLGPWVVNDKDYALIQYGPASIDLANSNISPFEEQNTSFSKRHWLGTDRLGRDVLAQMIHGSQTALFVGFGSVIICAILGTLIGSFPAYWGNRSIGGSRSKVLFALILTLFTLVYLIGVLEWNSHSIGSDLILSLLLLFAVIWRWRNAIKDKGGKQIHLPLELLSGRMIEIMDSLPLLFLIIALSAVVDPSISSLILIIGLSNWAIIARYARAETLAVKEEAYVESARSIGNSSKRILFKHILPNAVGPVLITLAFGVSAAILIESTLSFLGIGLSAEEASWGGLLAEGRKDVGAWWLIIPPGLAIFAVVYSCNKLGESLSR